MRLCTCFLESQILLNLFLLSFVAKISFYFLSFCVENLTPALPPVFDFVADGLLGALADMANRSLNGLLPSSFAEFFLGARLLSFRKKDDGVRPIAVGEVLRRLVAKVAFRQTLPDAQNILPPIQVGVGVAEAVSHVAFAVHSARQACLADASSGILQIDVSNAFNTLSRHEILDNVRSKFPKLQRWAH